MSKILEKNVAEIIIISLIMVVLMSSCGVNRGLSIEQVDKRNQIDYELDKLYLKYSYQRDSLIMEFYNVNKK